MTFFWALYLAEPVLDDRPPSYAIAELVLAAVYITASCIINYYFIPMFFYKGKALKFFLGSTLVVVVVALFEELVLERLFFPGSDRAEIFEPFFAVLDITITLTIFTGLKLGFDAWERQLLINKLEREKMASQMDHLKAQISPHFLFNNLNNLYSKALEGSKETPQLIHQLANIMRYMLYESHDKFVPISKELQHLSDYVSLQEVQIEGRGRVDFDIQGDQNSDLGIAPLLLIGFVENCFKHGFSEMNDELVIKVHIEIEGNKLEMICENPYSKEKERVNESLPKGIGLKNVRNRLTMIYPDQHELRIEEEQKVFRVRLSLDLERND